MKNKELADKRRDEEYDAKMAYDKDLTGKARLHYLENDRHDHEYFVSHLILMIKTLI